MKDEGKLSTEMNKTIEAERATIGSMMLNESAVTLGIGVLGNDPTVFVLDFHRQLYERILRLHNQTSPIDAVLLAQDFFGDGDKVSQIATMTNNVATSANVEYYAALVRDAAIKRSVLDAASRVFASRNVESREFIESAEKTMRESFERRPVSRSRSIRDIVPEVIEQIDAAIDPNHQPGIMIGLSGLDDILTGWKKSTLNIVAGRPGMGKTAFLLHCAAAACAAGTSVLFFSIEMEASQLVQRLVTRSSKLSIHSLVNRTKQKWKAAEGAHTMRYAAAELAKIPLMIDDSPRIKLWELRGRSISGIHQHDVGLIVIDYLQLLTPDDSRPEKRYLAVGEISRGLKALAKEAGVPVVAGAQLSREADNESDPYRLLKYLRESGNIEQDADVVLMLTGIQKSAQAAYREKIGDDYDLESIVQMTVAKHRNGPIGRANLQFDRETQTFTPLNGSTKNQPEFEQDEIPF